MLETVTKGFRAAKNRLAGKTEITPELVDESLRDIRVSLLEADVAFDVVKKFVARVREKARRRGRPDHRHRQGRQEAQGRRPATTSSRSATTSSRP